MQNELGCLVDVVHRVGVVRIVVRQLDLESQLDLIPQRLRDPFDEEARLFGLGKALLLDEIARDGEELAVIAG